MLRAIVIDDEEAGIKTLMLLIERHAGTLKLVANTTDEEEGISLIEDYKPDIVFLDISMPTMSGFELLSRLSYKDFKLVFTTAHEEFAIQAIKNDAFDYLLKPIDAEDFKNCLIRITKELNAAPGIFKSNSLKSIELSVKDGIVYIKQSDIIRLEASRSYTIFYLDDGIKHVASKSLKEYESHLSTDIFYRCHHSHIVNLQKVKKFVNHEGFFAQMSDGSLADVSKKNKDVFLDRLKNI